ncbi:MAG: glycosyltransferase family 2 protein, partial [Thiotrichaceae bacterium]|nr:glycosyltransferase family 2 protein [Thiotrichaceae bacterium]
MISVVVICNKKDINDAHIVKSLNPQSAKHELIIVNNENNNNFTSASSALNYGGMKSTGDYIMFAHQDIEFLDSNFLTLAENYLENIDCVGIAGVAGISSIGSSHKEKQRNIIDQGYPIKKEWGNKINTPENVQTLDECLLIVPADIFNKYP